MVNVRQEDQLYDLIERVNVRRTWPRGRDWQRRAECRQMDPAIFAEPVGGHSIENDDREATAKRACANCLVRVACLEHALRFPEPQGIWGGMTGRQRSFLRTRLRKLRQRQGDLSDGRHAAHPQGRAPPGHPAR